MKRKNPIPICASSTAHANFPAMKENTMKVGTLAAGKKQDHGKGSSI